MNLSPILSIISITKDDPEGIYKTSKSIISQNLNKKFNIEILILDGSKNKIQKKNIFMLSKLIVKKNLFIKHINMIKEEVYGIYNSMNFGLIKSNGLCIIFLNGGDTFFDSYSISYLLKDQQQNNFKKTVCFGQALIVSKIGLEWDFPGKNIHNIKKWLKYFEPNHQSMLVSADIATKTKFLRTCSISADKFWKREVIRKSQNVYFIRKNVCKFFLDGTSSQRPRFNILIKQLKDKHISTLRKIIIILKFLIIPPIYKYLPYIQVIKSKLIDYIF